MTIDIKLNRKFTDTSGLPGIPWGNGVTNPVGYRWTALGLGDAGDSVAWKDDTGRGASLVASPGTAATVAVVEGSRVARLDGTGKLDTVPEMASQGTVAFVCRLASDAVISAQTAIMRISGGSIAGGFFFWPDGSIRVIRPGDTTAQALSFTPTPGRWFTLGLSLATGAGGSVLVNGSVVALTSTVEGGNITRLEPGFSVGRTPLSGDIAEVNTFGARLGTSPLQAFHAAMVAHYGAM